MLAIIENGSIVAFRESLNGQDMNGRTAVAVPEGFDPVAMSHLWQGGQWVENPTAGVPPAPPPPRPVCVDLHSDAGATLTLTNMPAAAQFMANSNRHIEKIDLSMFTQARLLVRVLVVGFTGAIFAVRVHSAFSTVITDYQIMGADGDISVPLNALGVADSGWQDIAPAALADNRFVAVRQSGGDGVADPQIGRVSLWLR